MEVLGTSHVTITDSSADGNVNSGFEIVLDGINSTLVITDSSAKNNGSEGFYLHPAGDATIDLSHSTASGNDEDGLYVHSESSTVIVSDSTFSDSPTDYGVWLDVQLGSTLTLQRVMVTGSSDGGIILFSSQAGNDGGVTIRDSTIAGNAGTGIMINAATSLDIFVDRTTISGNNARTGFGGGVSATLRGVSTLALTNSTISGNIASFSGGVLIN